MWLSPSVALLSFDFFFFNDTATTEIYTLSLHDALPICGHRRRCRSGRGQREHARGEGDRRSEEHTSELQSHLNLVCRLLLDKKKKIESSRTTGAPVRTRDGLRRDQG